MAGRALARCWCVVLALALVLSLLNVVSARSLGGWEDRDATSTIGATGIRLVDGESAGRKLTGKFLHITDVHPDPFYKVHAATDEDHACHSGSGPAGVYGAETTECDSPISLMNATFDWIRDNLKDEVDFVIWTGDSARHDNDEDFPRTSDQVVHLNEMVANKFVEVWGKGDNNEDPTDDLMIPVVPTFGNNDILPHNIFLEGPNSWTRKYLDVWRHFIPEEQRHQFQRGGWFYVEVIPSKLAVISLNTMYFFTKNAAVDGCAPKSEPGYEHFEWLRIQLELFRERKMKVMLMGHVPPARTESKFSWDETCWQKYALWMESYRDIVVGSLYGHMNIEHFMMQDFKDIKKSTRKGMMKNILTPSDNAVTVESDTSYLIDLRDQFSGIASFSSFGKGGKKKKKKGDKYNKIGGKFGERYAVSHVAQSVVPNYFPTLRVFEYNITGLEKEEIPTSRSARSAFEAPVVTNDELDKQAFDAELAKAARANEPHAAKKKKKHKFHLPSSPSKSTPPGPAYSPQTFSLTGYIQYFANLTFINNDFTDSALPNLITQGLQTHDVQDVDGDKWNPGKHQGKQPKAAKPKPKKFEYTTEYTTAEDKVYKLKDLSVRSYLKLATRIGKKASDLASDELVEDSTKEEDIEEEWSDDDLDEQGNGKKKHKKHKKNKTNKTWYMFIKRAFAGALDPDEIEDRFGVIAPDDANADAEDASTDGQSLLTGSLKF